MATIVIEHDIMNPCSYLEYINTNLAEPFRYHDERPRLYW